VSNHPDPRKHQLISFVKSGIRVGGCILGVATGSVVALAFSLLVAELVGVYEELV
jgi:hypothetical protein